MTTKRIALTFEGPDVNERGVPLDDLQRALGHIQRALELTVRHLAGLHEADPLPEPLKAQCELRVVGIYRGSLTVELELKSEAAPSPDSEDLGARALNAVLDWCSSGAPGGTGLQPAAAAELAAVREDVSSNLTAVRLATMPLPPSSGPKLPPSPQAADSSPNGERLEAHLHGTLSEVDWGRRTARLRQHGGTPVPLRFGADLDEDMLRLATQYVEVEGEGCIEADDERWTSVDVRRITGTRSCFEPFDLKELDGKAGFVFGRDDVVTVSDPYDHDEFMRLIREAQGA